MKLPLSIAVPPCSGLTSIMRVGASASFRQSAGPGWKPSACQSAKRRPQHEAEGEFRADHAKGLMAVLGAGHVGRAGGGDGMACTYDSGDDPPDRKQADRAGTGQERAVRNHRQKRRDQNGAAAERVRHRPDTGTAHEQHHPQPQVSTPPQSAALAVAAPLSPTERGLLHLQNATQAPAIPKVRVP
jgi:hypothetical protein